MRKSLGREKSLVCRWLTTLLLIVGLVSCASNDQPTQAELNNIASPQQWLDLAQRAKEPQRSEYRLNAARLYLRTGRLDLTAQTLAATNPQALASQQQKSLLEAQLYIAQGNMAAAEASFNRAIEQPLASNSLYNERYAVEAAIRQYYDDYWHAAQAVAKRYPYAEPELQGTLQQQLWQLLEQSEQTFTVTINDGNRDLAFDGWLALYRILNTKGELHQVLAQLQQWQQQYAGHPAVATLPTNLNAAMNSSAAKPDHVAIILPLSGKYRAQGHALRNGMLQAVLNDVESPTQLHFYDSGRNTIAALYEQIKAEGHDIIVGPLLKQNVRTLLELADDHVQVLALNQIDDDQASSHVSHFALSPEMEGRNAADFFVTQGVKHPLVLQASGGSYQRIGRAFEMAWRDHHDEDQAIALLPIQDSKTMQKQVQQILGITDSKARATQLGQALALKIESEPRSRADIDAVYVVGSSQQARLLKSFVDVTVSPFADPIGVYAGPRSHNGTHSEFEGIYVADIPLLTDGSLTEQKAKLKQLAPDWQYQDMRLFAMGYDALSLIPQLDALRQLPGFTVKGLTGSLSVSASGEVGVKLPWSRYRNQSLQPVSS
ncbi:penicillin-binding protein activator [Neiella marina]|uniref:Penicillin-binding protein activator n=1 Tax=Neiella holothuriorum TaxID=2870530 RepID=A0ABS7EAZ0_9GAMM|nr:penicillin-binding protein activator [Neiella holothuriorum]MBW8189501.1 penicillin-binding protein activator [Neiella holothuriorum]